MYWGWDILNLLLHWVFSKVVPIWFVIGQKKATCEPCFWIFSWKVKLRTPVLFGFLDTFINEFKAITVRYREFLNLLSILNSAVDINQNSFEKCKCKYCFWIFNSKFEACLFLHFGLSDTYRNKYEWNKGNNMPNLWLSLIYLNVLFVSIKITLEKCKSCFWNFVSNFELTTFPLFRFWETYREVYKGIRVTYAEFIISLSLVNQGYFNQTICLVNLIIIQYILQQLSLNLNKDRQTKF